MAFEPAFVKLRPEAVLLDNEDWVVVNKPVAIRLTARGQGVDEKLESALCELLGGEAPHRAAGDAHPIDDATSGLVVVPRSPRARAVWANAERGRAVFEYLALVDEGDLGRSRALRRSAHELGISVVERARGTAMVRIVSDRADAQAVRSLMARVGVPVLGDTLHSALPAWRLMLHLERVHLRDARLPRAPIPADFVPLLSRPESEQLAALGQRILDATWRRQPLAENGDAYRLVNDEGDGLPGITVDRFGDWAVLSLSTELEKDSERWLAEQLVGLGARGVYVKRRARSDLRRCDVARLAPTVPVLGDPAPSELVVREGALCLSVALAEGLSCGLFVDQRENRERLFGRVKPQETMLNLFAYTCSFSVAAAKAGALTTSVDLAAPALAWGRRNFELNELDPGRHEFFRADATRWLEGARRHGRRYHWVVLDPPSFSTSGRGATFSVAKDYCALAAIALSLLEPGGHLLAVTNHRKTTVSRLAQWIGEAASAAGRRISGLEQPHSPLDCPGAGDGPIPSKSLWARVE